MWFTADTHFSHVNILKYSERPFKNIKEHDEALIEKWNAKVQPNDHVYHLGDFGFGSPGYLRSILKRLNGKLFFVRGNHDKKMKGELLNYLEMDMPYFELTIHDEEMDQKQLIVLCHYPFQQWNKKHYGSWHCHGHCHGAVKSEYISRLDVGVDCHNYFPVSYDEIKTIFTKKLIVFRNREKK